MPAILLTCCGLKCAIFKRKFNYFEAVNRKNNLQGAPYVLNGGKWRVPGEGIVLCLTVLEPRWETEKRSLISLRYRNGISEMSGPTISSVTQGKQHNAIFA